MWKNMEKSGRKNKEKSPKFSQLFVGRQTRRSAKFLHSRGLVDAYNGRPGRSECTTLLLNSRGLPAFSQHAVSRPEDVTVPVKLLSSKPAFTGRQDGGEYTELDLRQQGMWGSAEAGSSSTSCSTSSLVPNSSTASCTG